MRCPCCSRDSVVTDGRAEADEAVLGEDEYAEHCTDCSAEWVRATAGRRVEILRPPCSAPPG